MKKNRLGNTDIFVSPVSFGVLTVGNTQLNLPVEEGAALIKYAVSKGINFFDTAQYYRTYPYLREALRDVDMSKDAPERPVICTKSLDLSYEEMDFAVQEALSDMVLEDIDIFLLYAETEYPEC